MNSYLHIYIFTFFLCLPFLSLSQGDVSWSDDGTIDLGNNKEAAFLPEFLSDRLYIYKNQTFLPTTLKDATQLKRIDFSEVTIFDWNETFDIVSSIPNLEEIKLERCLFDTLAASIATVNQIKTLTINQCQFLDFERVFHYLKDLDSLKVLELGMNRQLKDIPQNLSSLQQISTLIISHTPGIDYKNLFEILAQMPNLKRLELNTNDIKRLEVDASLIKHIEEISLEGNDRLYIDHILEHLTKVSQLKKLNLDFCKIGRIPNNFSSLLPNLETLSLNYNLIESLPESFGQLSKLTHLALYENSLTEFPTCLYELHNLTTLDLSSNYRFEINNPKKLIEGLANLSKIEVIYFDSNLDLEAWIEIYSKMPRIKYIQVDLAKDEKLPKSINSLVNLRKIRLDFDIDADLNTSFKNLANNKKLKTLTLNLNGDQSVHLPPSLGKMVQLEKIEMFYLINASLFLPKEIGNLIHLKELLLDNLNISQLPDEIGNLKSLEKLVLGKSKFKFLNENITKLKNLKYLDLSSSSLEALPKDIGRLKNLETFLLSYLDNDKVEFKIPPSIGKCKNLRFFNLKSSNIHEIPKEIGQLKNLEVLLLDANELTELPEEIGQLKKLKVLSIWYNYIKELPKNTTQLSSLNVLDISSNLFSSIPDEITSLSNLRGLFIDLKSKNEYVATLPANFDQLKQLTHLSLEAPQHFDWDNALTQIGAIKNLVSLKLDVKNTPLSPNVGALIHVKYLSLQKWSFKSYDKKEAGLLPKELGLLSNLQALEIYWNKLKEIPEEVENLKSLVRLSCHLGKDKTFEFNKNFFRIARIPNLKVLNIKDGQLGALHSNNYVESSIESLILSNNKISSLSRNFIRFPKLKKLDLSRNEFEQFPVGISTLENLKIVDISDNPLYELPISLIHADGLIQLDIRDTKVSKKVISHLKVFKETRPFKLYYYE